MGGGEGREGEIKHFSLHNATRSRALLTSSEVRGGLGQPQGLQSRACPTGWHVPPGFTSHLLHTLWFLTTRHLLHLELNHTGRELGCVGLLRHDTLIY